MRNLCQEAKIPAPQFSCKGNDFWTVFRKDIYNKKDLSKLGLNERQIDASSLKEKLQVQNTLKNTVFPIERHAGICPN